MASSTESAPPAATPVPDSAVTVLRSADDHDGIPEAVFFDDVPAQVGKFGAQSLIDKLSSLSQKYRLYETKLVKTRQSLENKIPDVRRALKAVTSLEARNKRAEDGSKPVATNFELSDGLFVRANIPATKSVCLWLGANVMVEYPFEEAISLLQNNLKAAENNLEGTSENLNYLRDQLNTTDINLSRVYNHHVQAVRETKGGK